ncbi:Ferritin-like diiron domain,Ferritin-like superfamily,Ferritin-related [Cinara cedri]|uniref:Ferritin n=1 Tax=Cinara cedri TaxID=506608 RepID=A0A5E4NN73_9HEMI|nr:Ferritin-like diiron domain,Ferritin-like superfamily,Ferritin-related [Cinara cedri]
MSIKLFIICMTSVFCVGYVSGDYCYNDVVGACSPVGGEVQNCNARYGAFKSDELLANVQNYANTHILRSFQFLLMSSHFGNYEKNRAGFEKLYRKMSDQTWEKAIDLVKFMGKRGAHMNFRYRKEEIKERQMEYELYELASMAKALDMQKGLAEGAHFLHGEVTRRKEHDAEVASFLENNFVHQHSEIIRELSGYTNDIKQLIGNQPDPSLSLYLFDEYLQKAI